MLMHVEIYISHSFPYDFYVLYWFQGFNGADLRNVCTEAGMAAIRAERDYVIHEDFMKVKYFNLITLSRSFMLQ
jgi:ATP-dependent 26S proteasome regulatory subunit